MDKFNILLVDDIKENLYSLEQLILNDFDVNIFSCLNAQKAITILMENDIDLILTDVQMPEINGFEFAEYLNEIEKTKDIPLIFITGIYDKDEYKSKGYNLGAIEYITKPINSELLNSKLNIYIELFKKRKLQEQEIASKDALLIYQSKFVAMAEMISMIAHQWRQPLTTLSLILTRMNILNELDKLDKKKFNDNYLKSSNIINQMSKTIDDFRDFYQEDTLKENISLEEMIHKSIELIKPLFEEELINFKLLIDDDCKDIILNLNLSKIRQVFLNLFKNSIDEFRSNNVENRNIEVNCYKEKKQLIIEVSDNAGGISDEIIDKVFEPYFSTKSKNGSGLGLYMSKMIIEQNLNASIVAQNKNNGACFIIKINI